MLTRIMTFVSILALTVALLWRPSGGYQLALQFFVCAAAILMVLQAWQLGKAWLALLFLLVAAVFNPVMPPGISRAVFLGLDALCLALFVFAALVTRQQPRLSIASITDRTPGSESL